MNYTINEICDQLNLEVGLVRKLLKNVTLDPLRIDADKKHFSQEQVDKIVEAFIEGNEKQIRCPEGYVSKQEMGYYSAYRLADVLGISKYYMSLMIRRKVCPPGKKIGKRIFWVEDDVPGWTAAYAKFIAEEDKHHSLTMKEQRALQGYYSIIGAADYLNVPRITFRYHYDRDKLPCKPTHIGPYGSKFFGPQEMDMLAKWYKDNWKRDESKGPGKIVKGMFPIDELPAKAEPVKAEPVKQELAEAAVQEPVKAEPVKPESNSNNLLIETLTKLLEVMKLSHA